MFESESVFEQLLALTATTTGCFEFIRSQRRIACLIQKMEKRKQKLLKKFPTVSNQEDFFPQRMDTESINLLNSKESELSIFEPTLTMSPNVMIKLQNLKTTLAKYCEVQKALMELLSPKLQRELFEVDLRINFEVEQFQTRLEQHLRSKYKKVKQRITFVQNLIQRFQQ